jgi:hypothetical protein
MGVQRGLAVLVVLLFSSGPVRAAAWQDAVRTLAHERTLAESCAAVLKRFGDDGAKARGSLAYNDAKADYDGVIAGLIVALARGDAPKSLTDLEGQFNQAYAAREAFCESARKILPAANGEKGPVADIAKGAIEPVVNAIKEIYLRYRSDDETRRKTIQTQLEETKWLPFASVSPLS